MAQVSNTRSAEADKARENYVNAIKTSAGHFATAAEQLANKGMPHLESTYTKMKADGQVDPKVAGRDTLRDEAEKIRKEAAAVKDEPGARKLGDRLARLDGTLQATAAQVAKQSPDLATTTRVSGRGHTTTTLEPNELLRSKLAPAIEQGRLAYAEGSKFQAQAQAQHGKAQHYAGPHKDEHKSVAGAERTARALASSEKLDKATRDKYAAVADKLGKLNEGIHDKASARAAYKEAQHQMHAAAGDIKRATDRHAETRAGMAQYAALGKHNAHVKEVALGTQKLATAEAGVAKAKSAANEANEKVTAASKPLASAKEEVEAKTKAVAPAEEKLKDASAKLDSAEKALGKTDAAVKAAQAKLEAIQAENKASLFGGFFGGSKKEAEAAKALEGAKQAHTVAEGKVNGLREGVESARSAAETAKQDLAQATEKLAGAEKVHAAAQSEATRLNAAVDSAQKNREEQAAKLSKLDGKSHKETLPNYEKLAAASESKGHKHDHPVEPKAPGKGAEKDAGAPVAKSEAAPKEPTKNVTPDVTKADAPKVSPEIKPASPAKEPSTPAAKHDNHSATHTPADAKAPGKEAAASAGPAESKASHVRGTLASVDPNARLNPEGVTPLMVAARTGDRALVQELLSKGADPSIKNSDGKTALQVAGTKEVATVLEGAMRSKDAASHSGVNTQMPEPHSAAKAEAVASQRDTTIGRTWSADSVVQGKSSVNTQIPEPHSASRAESMGSQRSASVANTLSTSEVAPSKFVVREDVAAGRPQSVNTQMPDPQSSAHTESMFNSYSDRKSAAPALPQVASTELAKPVDFGSSSTQVSGPTSKQASREQPEREMSR